MSKQVGVPEPVHIVCVLGVFKMWATPPEAPTRVSATHRLHPACSSPAEGRARPGQAGRGGAWEVREVQRQIHFHAPYGNSAEGAADAALDSGDPNGRVRLLNGEQRAEGWHPDPRHMGVYSEQQRSHAASRPLGL